MRQIALIGFLDAFVFICMFNFTLRKNICSSILLLYLIFFSDRKIYNIYIQGHNCGSQTMKKKCWSPQNKYEQENLSKWTNTLITVGNSLFVSRFTS